VVIASEGMAAWPPLRVLRWFGIQLVPCVLCVLWLKQHPPTGKLKRFLMRLDGKVFSKSATATISMSGEITRQITQLAGNHPRPILEFVPTYQPQTFAAVSPPPAQRDPFAVLFVGRIERAKGVFDLLEIARRLRGGGGTAVRFDLCGTGSELPALRAAAAAANLSDSFICHGHCDRPAMRERMSACHAMIVPTTSWFVEGFNQVVAEAAMAGRPVITSSICPAIERVGPAVVEVPPDDVQAYVAAIQRLRDDVNFYEQKRAACAGVAQQFYDLKLGWAATLLRALELAGTVG
jgi:glycogen(starch) synthase